VADPLGFDDPRTTRLDPRPRLAPPDQEGVRIVHLDRCEGDLDRSGLAPEPFDLSLGRTALCHEWFTAYGGAEETAALIARTLGIRDVYTLVAEQTLVEQLFDAPVRQTWISKLPHSRTNWSRYLPLMPAAWSGVDLGEYDTVITSSHAASNAVRTRPDTRRICYCYTPMRYAWEWKEEIGRVPRLIRPAWPLAASTFRRLDRGWASKVASFIVISETIRQRVQRSYGRDAAICHPPVDTVFFQPQGVAREDFYLWLGRMVPYKHPDFAILAAARARRRLVLVGSGPEMERLKRLPGAAQWADFRGTVAREEVRDLLCRARALLFPGVEDFGIAMAEAQAAGTPVIALGRGGATEIVTHGETGLLYDQPDPEGLAEAIMRFEGMGGFPPTRIRQNALQFSRTTFPSRFTAALGGCL
jgi:glycosyltransferase involved in cell wall biosynthesis